jgi:alpha-beta hydrolase superfamily lysophospholipase
MRSKSLSDEPAAYTTKVIKASDGYALSYRDYAARAPQRVQIVGIHGIQSHTGWYERSCRGLANAGCGVKFLDRRGSGRNSLDRGDSPGYRRLVDDVAELIQLARSQAPAGVPLHLMAISWGGKLAVALAERHPNIIDGLVLITPGFFPRVAPPLREKLQIAWARLRRPTRLFPIPLNDPELFTKDPRWLEFLRSDPLSLHQATARFLVSSVHLDRQLKRAAQCVRVPTLLFLAGEDRIIDSGRTRRFVESFPATDRQVIEFPGAAHTLEFECPNQLEKALIDWMNRHSSEPP